MDRYLVTGGAGFIGSHLVETLLREGQQVRVFDNFSTGSEHNLAPFAGDVELVRGDIRDLDAVRQAVAGVDVVLHQAALPSVQRSVQDPLTANDVNVNGTLNMLVAARDASARRVVFASSSSVYGDSPSLPKVEDMPTDPLSPYAVSKLAGERYCMVWSNVYGLPTVALRYFNVFGPRQDPRSDYAAVIPRFATAMLAGRAPAIYGDGQQSRDFTYIANVVGANLAAARAPSDISGFYNVACGERISLLDLVDAINELLGTNIKALHEAQRAGDVRHSQASIDKIGAELGWKPAIDFATGLQYTVDSFR
jgi:UDP-glucose 4-epimerase